MTTPYLKRELCSSLEYVARRGRKQLCSKDLSEFFPGQPFLSLSSDEATICSYLQDELLTPKLDRMSPHLWLMATPESSHISALHHQIVRGRSIVVTEKPELHLVWAYDRVFIKPIPEYMFSNAFWECYLTDGSRAHADNDKRAALKRAAVGFLRSYYYLVQHPSDFAIAIRPEHKLVPVETDFAGFCAFIKTFKGVPDDEVSLRYHYGELRLTRLNTWAKVFLKAFRFQKVDAQYGAIFGRYYAPLLFLFGIITVILSAMQVELAVQTSDATHDWPKFAKVSRWFSVATLLLTVAVGCGLVLVLVILILRETVFAARKRVNKIIQGRRGGRLALTSASYKA